MSLEERRLKDNDWLVQFRRLLQKSGFNEVSASGTFTGLNDEFYATFYVPEGDIDAVNEISKFLSLKDDGEEHEYEPKFMVISSCISTSDLDHLAYKNGVFYRVGC